MIGTLALTVLVAFAGACVPAMPTEPYLLGVVATTAHGAVPLGFAAGVGQTLGKVTIFLAARGSVRSPWLRRWLDRLRPRREASARPGVPALLTRLRVPAVLTRWRPPAALTRLRHRLADWTHRLSALEKPLLGAAVVLLSALVGLPPLLLVAFCMGARRMPVLVFAGACLVGRSARFVAVALLPALAHGVGAT